MNKKDLVSFVAEATGVFKKDADVLIDAVLGGIATGLVQDGKVSLAGFGNFTVKERAARVARNPKTGEEIHVPSKKVPSFKASSVLKEAVDK